MDNNDDKGAYRNADIQGDVLPGFRGRAHKQFYQRFLMMKIVGNVHEARKGLGSLLADGIISTGADVAERDADRDAHVNAAFTASGLERLGRPSNNEVFGAGLARRSVDKRLLGDPTGWRIGAPAEVIDVVLNVGAVKENLVNTMTATVLEKLGPAYRESVRFDGSLLPEGREHFGFRDSLAQPFVVNHPAAECPAHAGGRRPVSGTATWPNWAALRSHAAAEQAAVRADEAQAAFTAADEALKNATGQGVASAQLQRDAAHDAAAEAETAARNARRAARAAAAVTVEQRTPGVPSRPMGQFVLRDGDDFTNNGSYMVWLQLEQRPAEFWAMCRELAAGVQSVFPGADEDFAAALLVGRRLDGDALEPHPPAEPEDFSYYDDPFGRTCPAGAHTRLTNPRDVETAAAMILRRGIPYGPPARARDTSDGVERGLIFVCYQTDIENQYEKVQGKFANASYDNGQPVSRFPDAIISQEGRDGSVVEIPNPQGGSVGTRLNNTWVVPHGGLYLFVPSMAGLRILGDPEAEATP